MTMSLADKEPMRRSAVSTKRCVLTIYAICSGPADRIDISTPLHTCSVLFTFHG
jgi:hypothetical protein